MCRGCAGDTRYYVHLCVFPQASALPVTWRLMKDGYLIALDKRFCSRAWYCNGSAYFSFLPWHWKFDSSNGSAEPFYFR